MRENKRQKNLRFFSYDFLKKNRKAELSTQQIVLIIILIASFAVILFFLFRLGIGEKSEEQLCHNSVLQKASAFSDAPLQCYRNYVCITKDGSCEGLIKPEKIKVKKLDEVYGALAEEMADCWWMFGEGKVDYIGDELAHNHYCSICSQIYFDNSLENIEGIENKKLGKDGLYEYLAEKEYSKEKSYSQYIFKSSDFENLKSQVSEQTGVSTFGTIEIGNPEAQYFVVMGIVSEVVDPWKVAIGTGTTVYAGQGVVKYFAEFQKLAGTVKYAGGWIGMAIVVGTSLAAAAGVAISDTIEPEILALTVSGDGIENEFMAPTIVEANSAKFQALNCAEILTYA